MYQYTKEIEIKGEYDVVVCGGGSAGFPAAISAARNGASVCIIEKNNILGGVMTAGGNNPIALFYAGDKQIIKGIGWEFVKRLEKMGFATIPEFKAGIKHSVLGVTVNVPMAGYLLDVMCSECGIDTCFLTTVVDCIKDQSGYKIITADKSGISCLRAKIVIDASGDGDVCAFAGAQFELGDPETGELQPGTLGFHADIPCDRKYDMKRLTELFQKSIESGEVKKSDLWSSANPAPIFQEKGNNVNHIPVDKNYQKNRSMIEKEGRTSLFRLATWIKNKVPNQEGIEFASLCSEVALRETRRILCDEYITAEDYISAKVYPDGICYSFYPIDLHKHGDTTLHNVFLNDDTVPQIPYRALLPKGLENILVVGRCISGDRLAQSAFRVKASCMAMGEAAGTAAALCVKETVPLRKINIETVKHVLETNGAIVPR